MNHAFIDDFPNCKLPFIDDFPPFRSGDFRFAMEKSAYWQEEVFSEHVTVDKDVGIFFFWGI